jgi:hypothetical protein
VNLVDKPRFVGRIVALRLGSASPLGPNQTGPVEVLAVEGDWLVICEPGGLVVYVDGRHVVGIVPYAYPPGASQDGYPGHCPACNAYFDMKDGHFCPQEGRE